MAAAGLALLNVAYGFFILPESLAPENRRPYDWRRANPVGSLMRLRRYKPVVLVLASATFLWVVGFQALPVIWNYYTIARFHWTPDEVGYSLAAVGVVSVIMQGLVSRWLLPRIGERRAVLYGALSAIAAYLIYAFAVTGWQLYAGIAVGALSGLVYQSMQALMSREVDKTEQGELQGSISSVFSIASIIGPVAMTQVFSYFASGRAPVVLPGAPFVLAAILSAAMLAVFLGVRSGPSGTVRE